MFVPVISALSLMEPPGETLLAEAWMGETLICPLPGARVIPMEEGATASAALSLKARLQ